jgi:hypothetical protein
MADTIADTQAAIVDAANKYGVDPAFALSVAQRENEGLDPTLKAKGTDTISGIFQMSKGLRDLYGAGDSTVPSVQAEGFMKYVNGEIKPQMTRVLGHEPTGEEMYLGHHFGPARAAKMINGTISPDTPVKDVFSSRELYGNPGQGGGNPHIVRAGTIGNLVSSVSGDMTKRMTGFGDGAVASAAQPAGAVAANTDQTPFEQSAGFTPFVPHEDILSAAKSGSEDKPANAQRQTAAIKGPFDDDQGATLKLQPTQINPTMAAMPAPPPMRRAKVQPIAGMGLPTLPSTVAPRLGLGPQDVLAGKPILGGLSALMGQG